MHYAPVLISVYDRPKHVSACLEALSRNSLARETPIVIASDGSRNRGDLQLVASVRSILRAYRDAEIFASVRILESTVNLGSQSNSARLFDACRSFSSTFIRLEDDVVVGETFLEFMNAALERFAGDPEVYGICASLPPNEHGKHSSPFSKARFRPYGYASWMVNFDMRTQLDSSLEALQVFASWDRTRRYFCANPAAAVLPMIARGDAEPGDIKTQFFLEKNGLCCIYPPQSLALHRGDDGSGEHARRSRRTASVVHFGEASKPFFQTLAKCECPEHEASDAHCRRGRYILALIAWAAVRRSATYSLYRHLFRFKLRFRKMQGRLLKELSPRDNYASHQRDRCMGR